MPVRAHGKREPFVAVTAEDEVARGDVFVPMRHRPKPREGDEEQGIDQDGVRHGEEAVGADRVDERRHGDHRIGGVEVAAEQEPGDPGPEAAPAEPPFMEHIERAGLPARGHEAHHRDHGEKEDEDEGRRPVEVLDHRASPL